MGGDPGGRKQAAAATGMERICSVRKTRAIAIQIRGTSVLSSLFTWSGRFLKRHKFQNGGSTSANKFTTKLHQSVQELTDAIAVPLLHAQGKYVWQERQQEFMVSFLYLNC